MIIDQPIRADMIIDQPIRAYMIIDQPIVLLTVDASVSMSDRIVRMVGTEPRKLEVGKSFEKKNPSLYHGIRYKNYSKSKKDVQIFAKIRLIVWFPKIFVDLYFI